MPSFLPDSNTFERYGTTISAGENSSVIKIIYSFPLTDRFAIGTEVFWAGQGAIMEDIYGNTGDDAL